MADEPTADVVRLAVTGVPLRWVNDRAGYQCPYCAVFVCIPLATWAVCPRCPAIPVDETVALVLSDAGIDDDDLSDAVAALMPILRALPAPNYPPGSPATEGEASA